MTIATVTKKYNDARKRLGKKPVAKNHFKSVSSAKAALNSALMTVPTPEQVKEMKNKEGESVMKKTEKKTKAKTRKTVKRLTKTAKKTKKKAATGRQFIRHQVKVGKKVYRSVKQAFEELKLPLGQHVPFRMKLKAAGKLKFDKHTFELVQPKK